MSHVDTLIPNTYETQGKRSNGGYTPKYLKGTNQANNLLNSKVLPSHWFILVTTERFSRLLRILHQNRMVQAEQAQAHSPLPFSSHPRLTTNRCPSWPGSTPHTVTRIDLGKRSAWALDMDLELLSRTPQVQDLQGFPVPGEHHHLSYRVLGPWQDPWSEESKAESSYCGGWTNASPRTLRFPSTGRDERNWE